MESFVAGHPERPSPIGPADEPLLIISDRRGRLIHEIALITDKVWTDVPPPNLSQEFDLESQSSMEHYGLYKDPKQDQHALRIYSELSLPQLTHHPSP
jgi:hypothetical protein